MTRDVRKIIEAADAVFLHVDSRSVYFRDPKDGAVLSLYLTACRCTEDIQFALKAHREPVANFELAPAEAL